MRMLSLVHEGKKQCFAYPNSPAGLFLMVRMEVLS